LISRIASVRRFTRTGESLSSGTTESAGDSCALSPRRAGACDGLARGVRTGEPVSESEAVYATASESGFGLVESGS